MLSTMRFVPGYTKAPFMASIPDITPDMDSDMIACLETMKRGRAIYMCSIAEYCNQAALKQAKLLADYEHSRDAKFAEHVHLRNVSLLDNHLYVRESLTMDYSEVSESDYYMWTIRKNDIEEAVLEDIACLTKEYKAMVLEELRTYEILLARVPVVAPPPPVVNHEEDEELETHNVNNLGLLYVPTDDDDDEVVVTVTVDPAIDEFSLMFHGLRLGSDLSEVDSSPSFDPADFWRPDMIASERSFDPEYEPESDLGY
jgi:hypothetical protein